jgi:hypothetical protein
MNYFEFYKLMLETIKESNASDGQQLKQQMNLIPQVVASIRTEEDGILLSNQFQETLDNLIDDGLVKGKIIPTKGSNLYLIQGLSTAGYQYLKSLEKPTFLDKLKNVLKEEGLPLTPKSITKAIAKLSL